MIGDPPQVLIDLWTACVVTTEPTGSNDTGSDTNVKGDFNVAYMHCY